jgi:hypothetical protein
MMLGSGTLRLLILGFRLLLTRAKLPAGIAKSKIVNRKFVACAKLPAGIAKSKIVNLKS